LISLDFGSALVDENNDLKSRKGMRQIKLTILNNDLKKFLIDLFLQELLYVMPDKATAEYSNIISKYSANDYKMELIAFGP